jgi:hypothetical protein
MNNQQDLIDYDYYTYGIKKMPIAYTDNELFMIIIKALEISFGPDEYEIIQSETNSNTTKEWTFVFSPDTGDEMFYNYQPTYIVGVSFSEGTDSNFVELSDLGNTRCKFCRHVIAIIRSFIRKEERQKLERYLSRDYILQFIIGSIDNYDNFNIEHIKQICKEKSASKMRNVLENPMYKRELLEYIDV